MNTRLLLNRYSEDSNTFKGKFKDALRAFNPKDQVWKAKLQACPEPSNVVFIMLSVNTLQFNLLVNNILEVIK